VGESDRHDQGKQRPTGVFALQRRHDARIIGWKPLEDAADAGRLAFTFALLL
jgi:hypothetical protein